MLRMFGGRPNMSVPGTGGLDGGLPSGGMPPGGGPPGGGALLGVLSAVGPYLTIIAIILIIVGIILLTHKDKLPLEITRG
jgi:hypothetical protein